MNSVEETCVNFLISRRSIRKYLDKEVPLDLILKAIDIARYAPSAKNLQPWEFIVVTDENIMEELSKIHESAKPLRNAKVAIVVVTNSKISPHSHIIDGSIVTTYLWLALHCLGLGAVWIQTIRNVCEIRRILRIPDNYLPVSILAIGWPAEKPKLRERKSLDQMVYINYYGMKMKYS